ncbi:MAG: AAA family ATPase [Rhodospirillaceae bacterium]
MDTNNTINKLQGRISTVSIQGFRSLKKVENLELGELTILIGGNGVGKSNFIRFFEMLSWMHRSQQLQQFVLRHGGGDDQLFMGSRATSEIKAEIRIKTKFGANDYRFELAHIHARDTLILSQEAYRFSNYQYPDEADWSILPDFGKESVLSEQNNSTAKTIHHLLKQSSVYQFHDTSKNSSIHTRWDLSDFAFLRSDGGNLAPILFDLKENDKIRYRQIVRQIQRILPTFDDFFLESVTGKVLLSWKSKFSDKTLGTHLTSDGSLRVFCLLTLLNLPMDRLPDILFFDEPELGLHPHAITLVSEMIKRVAKQKQVFIATQSPYMVDCFDLENIIVADAVDGATSFRTLPSNQYQRWIEEDYGLSDIWLKSPVGLPL